MSCSKSCKIPSKEFWNVLTISFESASLIKHVLCQWWLCLFLQLHWIYAQDDFATQPRLWTWPTSSSTLLTNTAFARIIKCDQIIRRKFTLVMFSVQSSYIQKKLCTMQHEQPLHFTHAEVGDDAGDYIQPASNSVPRGYQLARKAYNNSYSW